MMIYSQCLECLPSSLWKNIILYCASASNSLIAVGPLDIFLLFSNWITSLLYVSRRQMYDCFIHNIYIQLEIYSFRQNKDLKIEKYLERRIKKCLCCNFSSGLYLKVGPDIWFRSGNLPPYIRLSDNPVPVRHILTWLAQPLLFAVGAHLLLVVL